jgi:hypothetical protein
MAGGGQALSEQRITVMFAELQPASLRALLNDCGVSCPMATGLVGGAGGGGNGIQTGLHLPGEHWQQPAKLHLNLIAEWTVTWPGSAHWRPKFWPPARPLTEACRKLGNLTANSQQHRATYSDWQALS